MVEDFYSNRKTLEHLRSGPLAPHMDSLATLLVEQGYARATVKNQLRLLGVLSGWLQQHQLGVEDLDELQIAEFLTDPRQQSNCVRKAKAVLRLLLEYLRNTAIVPPAAVESDDSPLHRLLHDFARYLAVERGLSSATLDNYLPCARCFLSELFGDGPLGMSKLGSAEVSQFVVRQARTVSRSRAQLMVKVLRALFHFLRLRGDLATDLAAAVPGVATWRLSGLPKSLLPDEVDRVLKSCDQSHPVGQRDYSILLLLARLGLRAGEVVAIRLEDLDWRQGEFTVRGKGSRQDRLPIPHDVGEALATYLRQGRPRCVTRRLFVRMRAPHREFASSGAICSVVKRALQRAGLNPASKGAHPLRHSLATDMLRQGASMAEIGQVLRHRLPSTTEIYAKVDLEALRSLAPPWPGGEA